MRADSEHDDRRPRYLIRLLMRTIYVQCPCLMIQELLWPAVRSELLDLDYLGRGWIDEFVFELWIMIWESLRFVRFYHLALILMRVGEIVEFVATIWLRIICLGCEMIIRERFYGSISLREKYMARIFVVINLFFLLILL